MARVVFAWLFAILVFFFFNNSLLSQLQQPVSSHPDENGTTGLPGILDIPQYLLYHYRAALGFDILLTCSCIICIIIPQQRLFTWISIAGVWILYMAYCSIPGDQYAQVGYLLAPLPFLALKDKRFDLFWNLFRYGVCILYVSIGVYKIYYAIAGDIHQLTHILLKENAAWFMFIETTPHLQATNCLMQVPEFLPWYYRVSIFIDLLPVLGFFTKKFDKWLLAVLVIFQLVNLLLLSIPFVGQSLIFAAFLPWQQWAERLQINNSDD